MSSTPRSANTLPKSRGRGAQLGESKSRPWHRREISPSHPWLARPTLAITCTRSAQCLFPSFPSTQIDGQTMPGRARGGGSRSRGSQSPWRCGLPRRVDRVQDSCVTPSPSRRFVPRVARRAPECGCPISRAICPDRTWRGPPRHLTRCNSYLRLPQTAQGLPGIPVSRSGAGVHLTGSSQRPHDRPARGRRRRRPV